ncbi:MULTISPECIES: hypothetical protein [unclassified Mycolicibacterium]|uniref:hypothetical protein n=1 Tax=unclassified Mycolicibacterium TaxID=2636767 RepID=UPI0035C96BCE
MNPTPTHSLFDEAYESRTAPWVIGEPQPAIGEPVGARVDEPAWLARIRRL